MIKQIALLALLATSHHVVVQAQDLDLNATDDVFNEDAFDELIDNLENTTAAMDGFDFDDTICTPLHVEMETCDVQNNCTAVCEPIFEAMAEEEDDDSFGAAGPLDGLDPTDAAGIEAALESLRVSFDNTCVTSKMQVCVAYECCPNCVNEMQAAIQCEVDTQIPKLNATLVEWIGDLSDAADSVLDFINGIAGDVLNTTLAPAGSFADFDGTADTFSEFFGSLKCDFSDNTCGDGDGATGGDGATPATGDSTASESTPDATPPSEEGTAPGEAPAPEATPAAGETSAPGTTPAPGPAVSGANRINCIVAAVVAAAGMMLL